MVIDLILNALALVVTAVLGVLPHGTLGIAGYIGNASTAMGSMLGPLDALIPMQPIVWALVIVVTVLFPAFLIYMLANWVWRHIPMTGSGG